MLELNLSEPVSRCSRDDCFPAGCQHLLGAIHANLWLTFAHDFALHILYNNRSTDLIYHTFLNSFSYIYFKIFRFTDPQKLICCVLFREPENSSLLLLDTWLLHILMHRVKVDSAPFLEWLTQTLPCPVVSLFLACVSSPCTTRWPLHLLKGSTFFQFMSKQHSDTSCTGNLRKAKSSWSVWRH